MKMHYLYLLITLPLQVSATCDQTPVVPNLLKRSRLYKTSPGESYIDDSFLKSQWYTAEKDGVQYFMPDKTTVPSTDACGSKYPIYIRDTHPVLNEGENVTVNTCMRTLSNPCGIDTVSIRNCSGKIQYELYSTFYRNSSFCFDPPTIRGVQETAFAEPPTQVTIGRLTVTPDLQVNTDQKQQPQQKQLLKLKCEASSVTGDVSKLFFFTHWYINSEMVYSFEKEGSTTPLIEPQLDKSFLGTNVSCGVHLASTKTGKKTNIVISNAFFAGIKISNSQLTMKKGDTNGRVLFERTIPFGCQSESQCEFLIQMNVNEGTKCDAGTVTRSQRSENAKCGVVLKGIPLGSTLNSVGTQTFMDISTTDITDKDPNTYILKLKVQPNAWHEIWSDYLLEEVTVTVVNDSDSYVQKFCKAENDPHMQTADKYPYEHQYEGEFIMYKNVAYQTEVQIKTKSCNSNIAYCTCAVAIHSGGDVFLVNYCDQLKDWKTLMSSCNYGKTGVLFITNSVDQSYVVETPIGTQISINYDKWSGLMNVIIRMAPKDLNNVVGLCGKFDGNKDNELYYRNGSIERQTGPGRNYHKDFSEQWRLRPTDKNYLLDTCINDVASWEKMSLPMYCVCEKCLKSDSTCTNTTNTAHCSPSQYINCPRETSQFVKDKCAERQNRCVSILGRKKRHVQSRKSNKSNKIHWERIRNARRKRETKYYSDADAEKLCATSIQSHPAFAYVTEATGGLNVSQAIANCVFDTVEGQSDEWVKYYINSVTDIVSLNMERDPEYVEEKAETVAVYKSLSCPSNCSGNGICTENGTCECNQRFNGSDCSIDISAELSIFGVEGDGLCGDGDNCESFLIHTFDLVRGFLCRIKQKEIALNGSKSYVSTNTLSGRFIDIFTAVCVLPTTREKRSTGDNVTVFAQEYDVSISNDGGTFSKEISVLVFDSTCQTTTKLTDGSVTVSFLANTCFIDGNCYAALESRLDDECYKCIPNKELYTWTYDCTSATNNTENTITDGTIPLYGIVLAAVIPSAVIIVIVAACLCHKKNKRPRVETASPSKPDQQKAVFNSSALSNNGDGALTSSNISLQGLYYNTPRQELYYNT